MKAFSAVTKVGGVAFMPLSIDFPRIKVPVVEHVNARNSARLGDACRILLPHLFSPTSLQNGLKDLDPKKVAALVCKSFFFSYLFIILTWEKRKEKNKKQKKTKTNSLIKSDSPFTL